MIFRTFRVDVDVGKVRDILKPLSTYPIPSVVIVLRFRLQIVSNQSYNVEPSIGFCLIR